MIRIALAPLFVACIENDLSHFTRDVSFAQSPDNRADILFVVDDSGSMRDEQDQLAAGFKAFVSGLDAAETDFHIAVITTTWDEANPMSVAFRGSPAVLTPEHDVLPLFADRVQVDLVGSAMESGLEAAAMALSDTATTAANVGFLRDGASLAVLFVSDEDDCSDGGQLDGEPAEACYKRDEELLPPSHWVDLLRGNQVGDGDLVIGAIVGTPDSACDDNAIGDRYVTAALMTDGLVYDICNDDWSTLLNDLGVRASGLMATFQLPDPARPDTIVVDVDGMEVASDPVNGWTYDESNTSITFHGAALPPRGSVVHVHYTVL